MDTLDTIHLSFNPATLRGLNVVLAIVMFGIALDMRVADFVRIVTTGRAALVGLAAKWLLFPALTTLLVVLLKPAPSIALGLVLVAVCPGGNMASFFTHHARGDTALAVALTGITTAASIILTPLSLAFWGGLYPPSRDLLRVIALDPLDMVAAVLLVLGLPLALGMILAARRPALAARMRKPLNRFSLVAFAAMVLAAIAGNFKPLASHIGAVAALILLFNSAALALGYVAARAAGLADAERRAISLGVGVQNLALGLLLVFTYFGGNGGMAIVAAAGGIWQLISGFALASWWRRREAQA